MKIPFKLRRETVGRALACMLRLLLAMLLSGARLFGGYAPFAVGMTAAAGPGWEGLGALIGALSGALLFLDFPHALRTAACCVLLFTASNAFCELKAYRKDWFLPAMTIGFSLAVEAIYVLRSESVAEIVNCALAVALAALFAPCARIVLAAKEPWREHPAAFLLTLVGILAALSTPQFRNGLAPGRTAAVLTVLIFAFDRDLAAALASALCIGLAVDLAAPGFAFLHTACYGFGALLTNLFRRTSRVRAAILFAMGAALFALPLESTAGLVLLYECLAGTLLFLLLPTQALRALHEAGQSDSTEENGLRRRLRDAAAGLRELYDSVSRADPLPEENPAAIYDRAAEAVCRDCALRERCWVNEYNRTYTALSDATPALLRNGEGSGADFAEYFSDRCIRFPSFLRAVNEELRAFLLRRQYRRELDSAHAQAAGQYAQFSELLARTAECGTAEADELLTYRIGLALRPREGETVSGDNATSFETERGELCLLLSDGMGSGEQAQRESAMAVRLIERFLRAGADAEGTLQTLNSALNLRAETTDSFTTIDLLLISLKTGEGELYKYGAAPSYIKRGADVRRVSCAGLPAGLADGKTPPEKTNLRIESGSFFVMVSDGVADAGNDDWLQLLLAQWTGENPQQLVSAILAESYEHKGTEDDAGALALYLPGDSSGAATEV